MGSRQDSSHPTGVVPDSGRASDIAAQRKRKADAALALRLSGANWPSIAQALGYPTPRAAQLAVEKTLVKQLEGSDREVLRAIAGARLERLLQSVWGKANNTGDPDQLSAVSRARELVADHRKLFGLDAPSEVVVHTPTQDELEGWVLRMTATMVPDVIEPDIYEADIVESKAIGT
jgi:hypothetical protein